MPSTVKPRPPPGTRPSGRGPTPPTPHEPNTISKAWARIGLYASLDHMTCLPSAEKVLVSHSRSSSLKLGSPATTVEKPNEKALVALSTTHTWLHQLEPSYNSCPPTARPLLYPVVKPLIIHVLPPHRKDSTELPARSKAHIVVVMQSLL